MKRRARARANPFPHDSDYDFGDAGHLPIVPVIVEDIPADDGEEPPPPIDTGGARKDFPPTP